jgi:hypothetical protein
MPISASRYMNKKNIGICVHVDEIRENLGVGGGGIT